MTIKEIALKKIIPYHRNPRKNDATIPPLMESIKQFGFNQPLVLDEKLCIIVGHARYKAAKALGMEKVPCIIKTDLPPEKVAAYRLADNSVQGFTKWDNDDLMIELREIQLSTDMQAFFSDMNVADAISKSLGGATEPITAADVAENQGKKDVQFSAGGSKPDLVTFICPHCMKSYQVDKKDLPAGTGGK